MVAWAHGPRWNPAACYTLGGALLLAFSLYLPWLSASRTARVERRAAELAGELLQAAVQLPPPRDEAAREHLVARWLALAVSIGGFTSDLTRASGGGDGVLLRLQNKHYVFQLAASAPPAQERRSADAIDALEVAAWPRSRAGPGASVFFVPENAPRAYTRNLSAGYAGKRHGPLPGQGHRRHGAGVGVGNGYRGQDGERWLYY